MNIVDIRPTIPDMQAIEDDADRVIEQLEQLLDTLEFVHHVDKPFLASAQNNLQALKTTLRMAIRVRQ